MVQESVMIAIDNSEWMRNGDLAPTRLQCQQDAVNFVLHSKLRGNPENGVGLLSMSPDVEVLSTITRDDRKLFMKLHEVQIKGNCKLFNALKIAHLALRHRQNRNQKMRIVAFIGSPIEGINQTEFIRLAKKLKKEKVNVDFVIFGEASAGEDYEKLLQEFVDTVNGKESQTSHLLAVNVGSKLVDALVSSPICRNEDGNVVGGGMDFGNIEEDDPELALALRVSLEEQRQRQQREVSGTGMDVDEGQASEAPAAQQAAPAALADGGVNLAELSEEDQLAMAVQMSMQESTSHEAESMEVDESVGDLIDDTSALQQLVDEITKDSPPKKGTDGSDKPAKE